jgi:hypothetical protein
MARKFPGLEASRLFRVGVCQLTCVQRPQNEDDLQQKITVAFAQITPEMLRAMWRNLSAWYELCRGGHVE